jgi:hypothetical protein
MDPKVLKELVSSTVGSRPVSSDDAIAELRRLTEPLASPPATTTWDIAVHTAAQVMAAAERGEILVSSTVRDLALGTTSPLRTQHVLLHPA